MFLFREKVLIMIGVLAAVAGGCSMPVMIILFGQLANAFVSEVGFIPTYLRSNFE